MKYVFTKAFTKAFTIGIIAILVSGCQSATTRNVSNEWYIGNLKKVGDTSYDPPNGDWIFIRNEPGAATRQAWREQGWTWGKSDEPPVY